MLPTTNRATSPISTPARQAAPITSRTRRCIAAYCTRRPSPMLRAVAAPLPSVAVVCRQDAPSDSSLPPRPLVYRKNRAAAAARTPRFWRISTGVVLGGKSRPFGDGSASRGASSCTNQAPEPRNEPGISPIPDRTLRGLISARFGRTQSLPGQGSTRGPAAQSGPRTMCEAPPHAGDGASWALRSYSPSSRAGSANQPSRSSAAKSGREPPGAQSVWPASETPGPAELLRRSSGSIRSDSGA